MLHLAANLAAHPLSRDCLLGCAAVFLVAAVLDGLAAKEPTAKLPSAGLWLLRGGWILLTTMLAYQGLRTHALPVASPAEILAHPEVWPEWQDWARTQEVGWHVKITHVPHAAILLTPPALEEPAGELRCYNRENRPSYC
jgi:hypothetical protein